MNDFIIILSKYLSLTMNNKLATMLYLVGFYYYPSLEYRKHETNY
jgi:hypothetical protein